MTGILRHAQSVYRGTIRDALETSDRITDSAAIETHADSTHLAFFSRCVALQVIGGAGVVGQWMAGFATKPFAGEDAFLCWLIVGIGALGIPRVFLRRWADVQWLATHVVRRPAHHDHLINVTMDHAEWHLAAQVESRRVDIGEIIAEGPS
jgi:hypothetical protein